ncbi:MAG: hypothetical protein P8078_06765 [bacterium]
MKGDKHTSLINLIRNSIFLIFVLNCLLWCGCEKLITGYGPQPSYIDKPEYEQKLNILGILRPDSLQGRPQSFVHVEKAISIYDVDDSLSVDNVEVSIIKLDQNVPVDSVQLIYSDFNGFYDSKEYRNGTFFPQAKITYEVKCKREGFPELKGRTAVPSEPEIISESVHCSNNNLFFTIKSDSLASLYYIYLKINGNDFFKQIVKKGNENIDMVFHLHDVCNVHTARVTIIAYDNNMSEYISYNVNIKPNTYREDYSTVENGYGCFGSLNITEQDIYF